VLNLYDMRKSEVLQSIMAHTEAIWSIDWHERPAGSKGINLLTGSSDHTIKFWGVLLDKDTKS